MRATMPILMALLAIFMTTTAHAQDAASKSYVAGKDYVVLNTPVRTSNPEKIEVTEVFWYGCPHCYQFKPVLQQWRKTLSDDVSYVESPAMWNAAMEVHARIFYTAKVLNVLEKMHKEVFDAMHINKQRLRKESEIKALFAKHGIDEAAFKKTFSSFGVNSMIRQANARARSYGISGTPEIVVDGKYRITSQLAGGQANMLKVASFLIAKLRSERSS